MVAGYIFFRHELDSVVTTIYRHAPYVWLTICALFSASLACGVMLALRYRINRFHLKVVPECSPWRWRTALFLLGLVASLTAFEVTHWIEQRCHEEVVNPLFANGYTYRYSERSTIIVEWTRKLLWESVPLILLPTFLACRSWHEQRWHRAILEAASLALGMSSAAMIHNGHLGALPGTIEFVILLVSLVFYVVVRTISLVITRTFVHNVAVQTGTLCWTCGYDLRGNASGVCPECGEPT